MTAENYFVGEEVAGRYEAARPALHHHAVDWLGGRIALPVSAALDVGCGTGLSTQALSPAAEWVVGLDPSSAMLRFARKRLDGPLVLGDGDRLPFKDEVFDLVVLSSVLHWLSDEGVAEVARVLRPHGFLVAYDVWFLARMRDEPAFTEWMHGLSKRYPQVAKAEHGKDEMREAGLEHVSRGDLERWITMDMRKLCDYLMTHSERLAAVHHGRETEAEQRDFLLGGLGQFFGHHATRDVGFGLAVDLYERV